MASLSARLNRRTFIFLTVLTVLIVGGILLFIELRGPGDDAQIQQLVQNFASAADHQDGQKIMTDLCQVEAAGFADSDAADSTPVATSESHFLTTSVSDVQVADNVASAKVTRTRKDSTAKKPSFTLYFRKERGVWKVCQSAATEFKKQHKGSA